MTSRWDGRRRCDPKAFPTPDDLKIDRYPNRHLTFGFGIHTCPGASLARMDLRVLLEELLRRIPDLSIPTVPEYHFGGGDYSFIPSLPGRFTPGQPENG